MQAGCETGALVIDNAFGSDGNAPDALEVIVTRVREALARAPASLLILDDAASAADPLLIRLTIQAIAGLVGKTAVALRPAAGPMALANIVVALKSGIRHLSVSADAGGRYVAEQDVQMMLRRMGVSILRN